MRSTPRWLSMVAVGALVSFLSQAVQSLLTGEPLRLLMVIAWVPFWTVIHLETVRRGGYARCRRLLGF